MSKLGLVIFSVAAIACGKGKAGGAAKPIDVPGVNGLVPAALKDNFTFEETKLVEHGGRVYTVAAPKGWKQEHPDFATLKPPMDLGFMTQFKVGTNCDGMCEPKDWAAVVDKQVKQFSPDRKVLKDETGPNRRAVILEASDGLTLVLVASWKDGDREYSHCGGVLDGKVKDAAAAFAKACESVTVTEE
jgi:hypothetical protein